MGKQTVKQTGDSEKKAKTGKGQLKDWIRDNQIVVIYFIYAILIEMIGVFAVEGNPLITNPFIELGLLFAMSGIALVMKSNRKRFIFCTILLIVQAVLDLAFAVVYDMTGQYFDFGMLNLRNDAFGILESIPMNFIAFYSAMFFCIFFVIYGMRIIRRKKTLEYSVKQKYSYIGILFAGIILMCASIYLNNSEKVDKYEKMLKNKQKSNYSSYGIVGNLINEFSKGMIFTETEFLSSEEIDEYIYSEVAEPTAQFGVSKDKNVIVVLVESFEWFSILQSDEYPNQLDLSKEEIEYLFPNLTKFYENSVVMSNFHSREKTDISETLSIMGSYPTDAYVNYDFSENTIPQTVPNILQTFVDEDIQLRSFHDGFKSFYNREQTHKIFGFESLTDMYDMYDISSRMVKSGEASETVMHDYMTNGERNLDSEMFNTCKDLMFPTDTRFYTYITTITMHGIYYERENLADNYKKLEEVYKPSNKENEMEQNLINYLTAVMDFDKALGIMMEDLEEKGLLENTTIVLFGDHNTYYQQLSNYVKDIEDYETDNYFTDLYKVPFMIYDVDLEPQVIDKFTCTSDIAPTVLDLLGIQYYSNLYYGTSVFSEKESVLYSRAYGVFIGEGVVGRSMNSLLYKSDTMTDTYMEYFRDEAEKLVEKIKYCDQIFYQDYFGTDKNYNAYVQKMWEINS
ncbi:MAG: LTA synthase family protein [Lachnospiraceae bacterium]|nr:LTA synthase family protein [Lachnospiraceae bacterium]